MDDETLIICAAAIVCLGAVYFKKRRTTRRIWVNPYLQGRASKGRFRSDVRRFRWTNGLNYKCVECVVLV